jgi:hypothetical protein
MWNNFESLRDEFTDEASRLIEVDFPSLIRGVKLGFEEDIPFFTMELATETLQDFVASPVLPTNRRGFANSGVCCLGNRLFA